MFMILFILFGSFNKADSNWQDSIDKGFVSVNLDTKCIEFCTYQCIGNVDTYSCFDECTQNSCEGALNLKILKEKSFSCSFFGFIALGILCFFIGIGCFNTNLKNNENYWLL